MDSGTEDSLIKKRFVTEAELDERRKQRQEEWEKVRKPEDPEECPEQVYDPRSLFERLQEQKDKKQADFEEQFKFKNMVRGLDEDETTYLDEVSRQQVLLEKQRRDEDAKELKECRSARTKLAENTESKKDAEKKAAAKPVENKSKFSQAKLLAGAVKRKSTEYYSCVRHMMSIVELVVCRVSNSASSDIAKKQKTDNIDGSGHDDDDSCDQAQSDFLTGSAIQHPSASVCVGILPGLGAYSGSSDSDAESSSDSDIIISTGGRIISSVFRSHPFTESP
ncbi:PSME3-interacting protein isoform X1 [Scyliorhinus canicula]|uniref:PSME3-interacting protein isoform X1 n=1 Tax=Scyliorhinus canicula TaxID=7830 RepID=UPI0018F6E4B5|nr:PSME3-interacting protein isoform X1 [Scyliorhinus canicula]XP_038662791.1 PSME3-interacting protein isoform X1 [Scyliorhinus canicula]XP_038662792.1 PSME3-interacting protein isoform X1 [Scyliorhinus canicula]